ncbi:biopolymer transporter ExbD [Fulvivirgaceae bacterium BMA10]|uniref:Biopolymer transporter ExbD n=1 Tax=Splendidivirga corallicola TaxID=3051826 RepID=A0ABT8KRX0_9BACT|nr:biopolymer transporter ExbD [Fulvivirgaceae bacterium BMA10]
MRRSRMTNTSVNAGSMADIAFLLLIFFLVVTTILNDKGLMLRLPQKTDIPPTPRHKRNIYNVLLNSKDHIMIEEEEIFNMMKIRPMVKEFILNPGKKENLSVSPKEAVVSLKTNRSTSYELYIGVLNEIQAAYYEIYGERVGLSADEFRKLDRSNPKERLLYDQGRKDIPMNISFAEN